MPHDQTDIPEIGRIDAAGAGLLRTAAPASEDHRLEAWIASNLDASPDGARGNHWNALIRNLPNAPAASSRKAPEPRRAEGSSAWSRFHIAYKRGVTVVRLIDQNLIQQAHIAELGRDLMDLIAVGNHRLVLNFTAVERLGSWIIGVVGNAHRACAAGDGGRLKLCGLDAPLAEIFAIAGMARDLERHPDEATALDSPWPAPSAPRGLPVDLLNVLLDLGEAPPIGGGAPIEGPATAGRDRGGLAPPARQLAAPRVSLRVQSGSREPRTVRVPSAGLLIGRDGGCKFRIGSGHVSKRHATIEPRDRRVFLRDLGSTNGTILNGQALRDEERELSDGDTIRIGPVTATVAIAPGPEAGFEPDLTGDAIVLQEGPNCPAQGPEVSTVQDLPAYDESDPEHRVRAEVIEDVLVVTPRFEHLDDEASMDVLRNRLQALFEADLPRRVVVNLEFVGQVSRQTVALLLSHHIRLDWAGGGLRICQAHARIVALLDQVRLTMLVDCYPTLDEAVLASWSSGRSPAAQP